MFQIFISISRGKVENFMHKISLDEKTIYSINDILERFISNKDSIVKCFFSKEVSTIFFNLDYIKEVQIKNYSFDDKVILKSKHEDQILILEMYDDSMQYFYDFKFSHLLMLKLEKVIPLIKIDTPPLLIFGCTINSFKCESSFGHFETNSVVTAKSLKCKHCNIIHDDSLLTFSFCQILTSKGKKFVFTDPIAFSLSFFFKSEKDPSNFKVFS